MKATPIPPAYVSNAVGVIRSNFNGFTLHNLPLTRVKEIGSSTIPVDLVSIRRTPAL
jgi:hypothetical protein